MEKLSQEKIDMIRKFCVTHRKSEAATRFSVALQTVKRYTKGLHWKKSLQENLEVLDSGATFKKN